MNPRSFTVVIGIVWLAIVVTWGVRSVIGALLAGMLFADRAVEARDDPHPDAVVRRAAGSSPGSCSPRRTASLRGAIVMALCVIVGAGLSYRMWTKTSDDTAVHVILFALALVIGLLLVRRMLRLETVEKPMRIGLAVAIGVVAIGAAVFLGGLDLAETTVKEVPTMLFGLGAILLAREPRGAVYNMVNRQRLLQIEATERREEDAAVEAELAGVAP